MTGHEIVFNEISLSVTSVQDHIAARSCFEQFVGVIGRMVTDKLAIPVLRSQHCLQDAEIATNTGGAWAVSDWLEDNAIDRDLRHFILLLTTKIPIEDGLGLSGDQEEMLISYEFRAAQANGPDVYALGVALQTSLVVASVPTDPIWDTHQLDTYICENTNVVRKAVVDHVSREAHCDLLANIFINRCFDSIRNVTEFKRDKAILFPYLAFSPDVDSQVDTISIPCLLNAMAKMVKMNETVEKWRASMSCAPEYRFQWSPESASTMQNQNYRRARTFRMPTGEEAVFERHLYISDRHRIHFIEDMTTRTFTIGYIGDHLPTTKFPH